MPDGKDLVEISDLIRSENGEPVRADEVIERLLANGQTSAARIVRRIPTVDGVLDRGSCDDLIIASHLELQRLSEELQQPRRIAAHWQPWLQRAGRPARIVDVGCGTGHALRWLAAHRPWPGDVELIGFDRDRVLIELARDLAEREQLAVRFVVGDAFAPGAAIADPANTVIMSTGLLHHLPADALPAFFAAQSALQVAGFAHFDPVPGRLSIFGSMLFHRSRMRQRLSRHDGVMSVRRAHPAAVLCAAAAAGAPEYRTGCRADRPYSLIDLLRPVWGWRR